MKSLKQLTEEREDAAQAARQLNEKAATENRDWTIAETSQFESYIRTIDRLEAEIQLAEREREQIKGRNMTHQSYVSNKTFNENFPERQLPTNGVLPGDGKQRYGSHFRIGRLTAFRDEQTAFDSGTWIKAIAARIGGGIDRRSEDYCNRIGLEISNASYEGSGPSGGYTTPAPLSAAIIAVREMVGVSRKVCRVMPTNSDTLSVPKRNGGATVYYPNENQAITDSDPTWKLVSCSLHKRACLSYLSQELNEDSIINIADYLITEMAYALALQEDNELINGTGASTYGSVTGLMSSIGSAGVSTAASNHNLWSEIDIADMAAFIGKLPDRYFAYGPSIICSHSFFNQVLVRLAYAAGGATVNEIMAGTANQRSFWGYPVYLTSQMPVAQADSTKCALFGAFDQAVLLADRGPVRIARSEDVRFAEDQVAIKTVARYDMQVHDPGDSSNAGAYVALSTNAA